MFDRLFLAHPRSIGETFAEHFMTAGRFGAVMIGGGLACIVHAFVPALFPQTASRTVKRLHAIMAARQPGLRAGWQEPSWQIEYEI